MWTTISFYKSLTEGTASEMALGNFTPGTKGSAPKHSNPEASSFFPDDRSIVSPTDPRSPGSGQTPESPTRRWRFLWFKNQAPVFLHWHPCLDPDLGNPLKSLSCL